MLVYTSLNAQKTKKDNGFAFGGEAVVLFPYRNSIDSDYSLENQLPDQDLIWGFSALVDYTFSSNFYIGINLGKEQITPSKINYYPFMVHAGLTTDSKNGFFLEAGMGTHLGDFDQNGFIFRSKIGLIIGFLKRMSFNFGVTYSYQNLYTNLIDLSRPEAYYNIESAGLFLQIKLNRDDY